MTRKHRGNQFVRIIWPVHCSAKANEPYLQMRGIVHVEYPRQLGVVGVGEDA